MGAGPLRLLKIGATGGQALRGGTQMGVAGGKESLETALTSSASQPLKTSLPGRLQDWGNQALASQYGTISKPVARATNPMKTVGQLADYGILKPNDAERIAQAVTGTNGIINQAVVKAVSGSARVPITNVRNVAREVSENIGLVDSDAKSILQIVDKQVGRFGKDAVDADPSDVFKVMKRIEKQIADLSGRGSNYKMTDPVRQDKARVLQAVKDELQESLYGAAGANKNVPSALTSELRDQMLNLNPKSKQWQSFVDDTVMKSGSVQELRSSMAPFVRVKQMIDEGDINAFTMGGRVGNAVGMNGGTLANRATELASTMLKNPAARVTGSTLRGTANALDGPVTGPNAQGIVGRMGLTEGTGAAMGVARTTMPGAAMESQVAPAEAMSLEQAMTGQDPLQTGGFVDPAAVEQQQSQAPTNPFGVSREQLGGAMMQALQAGDTKAFANLKSIYDMVSEYESQGASGGFNSTTASQLAMSDNGLSTLNQLEQLYARAGGGAGKLGGGLSNLMAGAGLNSEVSAYNDLSASAQSQLAKAINGGGQVSDTDALLIANALPKITDSPETARVKLDALKARLMASRQNMMMYNSGATQQPTGLEGALTGGLY